MNDRASSVEVPPTFRRVVWGILVAAAAIGWLLGAAMPGNAFLLVFLPAVMGASFFGRVFAIPAAIVCSIMFFSEAGVVSLAVAAALVVVGERTNQLRHRLGRFAERSFTDRLTGLFNYDFLQAQVRHEVDRVRRYGGSCSLIVMDLDNFKKFNDTYGHQAGNILLKALADTVRAEKRDSDFAARFGGEEFVVLVPGDAMESLRLAERIRIATEELQLPQLPPGGTVTVSLGVASYPDQASNAAELFERADQALYHAKNTGKNRVIVWPNSRVRVRNEKRNSGPSVLRERNVEAVDSVDSALT